MMAKRILLPLDRSESARAVVPFVTDMARSNGASVRLLHVAPIPDACIGEDGRVVAYASQEMERIEFKRRDDLKIAEAELDGVPVESVVRFGDPVREILLESEAFGADLIAVTAERRGWFRPLWGGVVGAVVRRSRVPVLLLAAPWPLADPRPPRRTSPARPVQSGIHTPVRRPATAGGG